jgi:threonine/homoserine/homoserine lactone efflux protein
VPGSDLIAYAVRGGALGLFAAISPGPLMALILNLSLTYSAREGIKAALAPLLTDLPILLCALAAVHVAAASDTAMGLLALAGCLCLASYAVQSFRFVPKTPVAGQKIPSSLLRGVLANFLNPNPYVFWTAIGAPLLLEAASKGTGPPLAFAAAFFACICGLKAAIAVIAATSAGWLGSRGYAVAVRLSGVGLLYYAVIFLRAALARFGLLA